MTNVKNTGYHAHMHCIDVTQDKHKQNKFKYFANCMRLAGFVFLWFCALIALQG
jgi:plasmid rolling circle replication initiator protein Rep